MTRRKPNSLRRLDGQSPRGDEPQPDPTMPTCPAFLLPIAKREWRRVAPELHRLGLLTMLDRAALAAYCQAYGQWRQCEEILKVKGLTWVYTNARGKVHILPRPEQTLAQKYMMTMKTFCVEFGMTPSSRGGMNVPGAAAPEDPMDKLLNTRKWEN